MKVAPATPVASISFPWVKPSHAVKVLNVFIALFLIPVSNLSSGLFKFSYCKYVFSIAIYTGAPMAVMAQ